MNKFQPSSRPIAIWLLTGVFMIIVQIILGGITRLTDSGLSITEWKPLLGAIPPTTNSEWNKAFDRYKQFAQYKNLHFDFTLEDFKFILFLGMVSPPLGKIDRSRIYYSIYYFYYSKKI